MCMREREGKIDEYYISTIMMMEKRKFVGGKMLREKMETNFENKIIWILLQMSFGKCDSSSLLN